MSLFCGLVDFERSSIESRQLRRMAAATEQLVQHTWEWRGPSAGLHLSAPASERSARLWTWQRSDGPLCLAGDLRIDNRRELRALLEDGEAPATVEPTDAELLLAAYLRWGPECTERLDGDFSFALWDGRTQTLLGACDPMGVKAFFYADLGSRFCFASEVEPVLQDPRVSRCLDPQAVADYLLDNPEPPGLTFFRDVRRLLPGHRLLLRRQRLRLERYWQFQPARLRFRDRRDYAQGFLEHFERAVANRLPAGEPTVGIAMSGGLDSCSIAAVARRRALRDGGPRVVASTFTFDDLPSCDERPYVAIMTRELGFESLPVPADRHWLLGDQAAYSPGLASPVMTWDSSLRHMLSGLRERGVRVLLSGFGGDDLLVGSPLVYWDRLRRGRIGTIFEAVRYARRQRRDVLRVLYRLFAKPALSPAAESRLRRALRLRPLPPSCPEWLSAAFLDRVDARRLPSPEPPVKGAANRELWQAITTVASNGLDLHWYDRHAGAFGMEARHPFMDRRLAEFLLAVPPEELFRLGHYKPLLRQAMQGLLPEAVRLRPDKTLLGPFFDLGLQKESFQIAGLARHSLAAGLGILDGPGFERSYEQYLKTSQKGPKRSLWYAVTLEIWLRRHQYQLDFTNLENLAHL